MAQVQEKDTTPESVFLPQSEEIIPEDMALLNTLAELGQTDSDAKVNVYRAEAAKGNRGGAFLFSCHPDEFTLEKLRDEYGGGTYRIHVRANGSIVANRLVSVEEPKRLPATAAPQSAAPSEMLTALTAMAQAMTQGFEKLGILIVQNQPKPESRADMLKEMLLFKELFAPPPIATTNPLEFVKQGIDLAKELGNAGKETGTADIVMGLLDTFGKPIAEAVASAQAQQKTMPPPVQPSQYVAQAPTTPALTAPIPAKEAVLAQTPDGEIMNAMKGYINFLIAQAKADNDVYSYAGMILDQAPPEQVDQFIDNPEWLEYLAQFEPEIKNYGPWFTKLRDAIKELLTDEGESDTTGDISLVGGTNALRNDNNG